MQNLKRETHFDSYSMNKRIFQGILHFYDVDHLLGPLSISIGRMLKDLGWF